MISFQHNAPLSFKASEMQDMERKIVECVNAATESILSEAMLRLNATELPQEEITRRGNIRIGNDDTMRGGPTKTFTWDGKHIVQWCFKEWKLEYEWLPDAPPAFDPERLAQWQVESSKDTFGLKAKWPPPFGSAATPSPAEPQDTHAPPP